MPVMSAISVKQKVTLPVLHMVLQQCDWNQIANPLRARPRFRDQLGHRHDGDPRSCGPAVLFGAPLKPGETFPRVLL